MNTALSRAIRQSLCGAAASLIVAGAAAQDRTDMSIIETITVTAQKREQSILEVPISVTAIDAQALERAGVQDFEDYARRVPNVGFTQQGNRAFTKVSIRGVTNIGGKANSVGIYVDEFNIAPNILVNGYSRTLDTALYDVERIEVLRGPQGTYFGRNTMGGAISITTQKPQIGENTGLVRVEADDLDGWLARAAGSFAIGERAALGLSGYAAEQGGWIDNLGPSGASNDGEDQGGRIALRLEPSEQLQIDLSYSYTDQQQDYSSYVPSGRLGVIPTQLTQVVSAFHLLFGGPPVSTAGLPGWPLPTDDVAFYPNNYDQVATDLPFESESKTGTAIARINYDISDNLTLTSVTGHIDNEFEMFGDGDMSPLPAFTVGRDSESDAFSQELRLASYGNERFDWMIGAIYAKDEITETDISSHLATDPLLDAWGYLLFALAAQGGQINPASPQLQFVIQNGLVGSVFGPETVGNFEDVDRSNETESYAVFADATWHISDAFDLSFGLRYTEDEVDFIEVTRPTITLPVGTDQASGSFSDLSPRVAASWFLSETATIYANMAKGYKVGGFNSDVTAALTDPEFGEETGWNYELGFKGFLFDQRLQLSLAAFLFDWEDLQVRGQDPFSQRQFVQNAADAETQGVEFEMLARITSNVDFRLAWGHLIEAEFGDFTNAVTTNGDVIDATGNTIPYAPENTLSASLDVNVPVGAGAVYGRLDWTYVDDQFFDVENSAERIIPQYDLLDARVGFRGAHFDAAIFAKNLLDEEYVLGSQILETFYTGEQRSVGAPQTFGVALTYRF